MLQPLADLKEKQYFSPYLKDTRAHKNKGIEKSKVGLILWLSRLHPK